MINGTNKHSCPWNCSYVLMQGQLRRKYYQNFNEILTPTMFIGPIYRLFIIYVDKSAILTIFHLKYRKFIRHLFCSHFNFTSIKFRQKFKIRNNEGPMSKKLYFFPKIEKKSFFFLFLKMIFTQNSDSSIFQ